MRKHGPMPEDRTKAGVSFSKQRATRRRQNKVAKQTRKRNRP